METMRASAAKPKTTVFTKLSPSYDLAVGANTLSVIVVDTLFPLDDARDPDTP